MGMFSTAYSGHLLFNLSRVSARDPAFRKCIFISLAVTTAMTNNLPLATLNKKHFDRIDNLQLID
jgi:predicted nucleic acid-binding protein